MTPLVIISGPTAAGKTKLSIRLAKLIGGEIISADSMQVYKGMDIGSAKITTEEMEDVPHYLIDILDPFDEFNVAAFKTYAKEAIDTIISHGHIPIIVGGTGFYIQAVLYDIDFEQSSGEISEFRRKLEEEVAKNGPDAIYQRLMEVDPESARIIHKNNIKRVIRALEYYEETGEKISSHNEQMHLNESPYNFAYFVLTKERENLYAGIDRRVDIMIENGLVDEVKALKNRGLTRNNISMLGLGYKEILDYLDGKTSLDEAVYIIKRDTRHFAKKQLTWFRREKEVTMINKDNYSGEDEILSFMLDSLKEKKIVNE